MYFFGITSWYPNYDGSYCFSAPFSALPSGRCGCCSWILGHKRSWPWGQIAEPMMGKNRGLTASLPLKKGGWKTNLSVWSIKSQLFGRSWIESKTLQFMCLEIVPEKVSRQWFPYFHCQDWNLKSKLQTTSYCDTAVILSREAPWCPLFRKVSARQLSCIYITDIHIYIYISQTKWRGTRVM